MAGRDFALPHHLPQRREGGQAASPEELPRQRNGVTPQMHGRYPDFNVLDEVDHWDEVTRQLVVSRITDVPGFRFFTKPEEICLQAFCDIVMAQDREPRVPVLNMVDAKLYEGKLDGFRYHDMPDDRETWRQVARGLDSAVVQHGVQSGFAAAPTDVQREVVQAFSEGKLHGEVWDDLPCDKAFSVVMRAVLSEFYSHPWAWNEIGFGGPAYPRGYMRFGVGQREHWESGPTQDPDPVREDLEP
jgi:hypothetical protein